MITGKIKFLPENPPAPFPSDAPARSFPQVGKPVFSKPGASSPFMGGASSQDFTERTRAALQPLNTALLPSEAERRNTAVKTVIRWRDEKAELDVEEIVHRIIDRLHRES